MNLYYSSTILKHPIHFQIDDTKQLHKSQNSCATGKVRIGPDIGPDIHDPMVEVRGWQKMNIDKGSILRFQAAMSMLDPTIISHIHNKDCTELVRKFTSKITQDHPSDLELLR